MERVGLITSHVAASPPDAAPPASPRIPFGLSAFDHALLLTTPAAAQHVQWMQRKDKLGQDMMLLGAAGPMRRWLALRFCQIAGREVELITLTQDSTEADLKQRREIGVRGTYCVDSPVVTAALRGRVLILEGLEKVERNVLPVINNLLENREMQLEDGRFLVEPNRYDELLRTGSAGKLAQLKLERVHPSFRVIAISVPVPPFPGNPLDPPLRSRFQGRHVSRTPTPVLTRAIEGLLRRRRRRSHQQQQQHRHHHADDDDGRALAAEVQAVLVFYDTLWKMNALHGARSGADAARWAFARIPFLSELGVVSAARLLACEGGWGLGL